MALRNIGVLTHHYTASQPRIPRLEFVNSQVRVNTVNEFSVSIKGRGVS